MLVQWLWENPKVTQVGSPWNIDGGSKRSFDDIVHQDHLHVAVIGANDPLWVPAIGDLVWKDLDADGIQDPEEPGIGGVTVRLFDAEGVELDSTTTDNSGRYSFRELWYGEYHVEIDIPGGYKASPRDQGADETVDSDIDSSGVMSPTTLGPRQTTRPGMPDSSRSPRSGTGSGRTSTPTVSRTRKRRGSAGSPCVFSTPTAPRWPQPSPALTGGMPSSV